MRRTYCIALIAVAESIQIVSKASRHFHEKKAETSTNDIMRMPLKINVHYAIKIIISFSQLENINAFKVSK